MKTCVLYTFDSINKNVIYFIEHGIFDSEDTKFILISDHQKIIYPKIPSYTTHLVRKYGSNYFNSWFQGLETINILDYDFFIFASGSVIGPIIPNYYSLRWTNIFTNGITDDIKLFGSNISIITTPIVSANVFCLDIKSLDICLVKKIFTDLEIDSFSHNEKMMTDEILKSNYNIGSLLRVYSNIDFHIIDSIPLIGNIMESNILSNMNISPYDLVFIPTGKKMKQSYYTPFLIPEKSIIFNCDLIKGKYGAKDKFIDVTLILLNSISKNRPIIVNNDFFSCDPIYGTSKNLIIYYRKENNYRRLIFGEQTIIQ